MPPKRKRPDRPSGDGSRPSPHQPSDTNLARHDMGDGNTRGRGRGGHGPGGRGGFGRRDLSQSYGRGGGPQHQRNAGSQNQGQQASPTPARRLENSPAAAPMANATEAPKLADPPTVVKQPTQPPRPVSPVRSNYHFEKLTDDTIQSWTDSGRNTIIQHGVQARKESNVVDLSILFQEFIQAVVQHRLAAADAGSCVKKILEASSGHETREGEDASLPTLLLDSLAIVLDNDTSLYRPVLRDFLIATEISPSLMRQILDATALQQLGLIRDNFTRLGVRQATNLLYRQANYNLLREETEGYSKLITELFTTSSVPPPPPEMAEQTFERIKALIGTFDLDVGRVLDVTLDVAAAVLIKQYKFFVKFLRISSWWPRSLSKSQCVYVGGLPVWANPGYTHWTATAEDENQANNQRRARDIAFWDRAREVQLAAFFELGGRQVSESTLQQAQGTNGDESNDQSVADFEQQWIAETNTLPPVGNRTAAQLLGFKLLFYNSDLRERTDVLPANLLYLAALLIKVGFLSITDLYPHLSPADENMEKIRDQEAERLEKEERAARGAGQMNALLTAGVLPQGDDDNPNATAASRREMAKKSEADQKSTPSAEQENKNQLPEPLEQKVSLLTQLLTIGAIPESLFILGRFPWIPEVYPDVLDRIHRILHVSLEKVYEDTKPRPSSDLSVACVTKQLPDGDQSGMPKGSVRLHTPPAKKQWRWPYPEKFDVNENQNYRFYWDEWTDNIPVCQTVDDVFTLCSTFLNISGVNIGRDDALLSKIALIGSRNLADDSSEANYTRWHDLLRRLLLPALSHTKANASVVNAVWDLVKQYPLTTRYSMYAEWFEGQISRLPAMKTAFARATADTRGTMKRVSLTNLSEMAKKLAKTSYSSPGIVFRVAFEQLESYPNLIEAFVECAKYFTDLSYDVLVWSLLSSLGKSRSRTQAEHALTTSKWLQALSRFSGKVFRRYPGLNPTPVLLYVNDQLFKGNSTDLIILKEFISSMGGIVDSKDFTEYQVLSMAGGANLRRYTLIRAQDRRFENVKSSRRLMHALENSKLAARLLLNLSQYRQAAVFQVPEDEAHIKFLSSVVDESHQALIQYLDFLWSNLDPAKFDTTVPSIPELLDSYGLDISLAFLLGRISLGHQMFPWKVGKGKRKENQATASRGVTDKEGDVSMSDAKATSGEAANNAETQTTATEPDEQKSEDFSLTRTAVTVLQPIIESVRARVRPDVWNFITAELYTTFWALQLGDVCFPEDIYIRERQRIMSEWQALSSDRSDSRKNAEKRNEKRKELMDLQSLILEELSEHGLRKAKWKYYLTRQFQTSFPNNTAKPDSVSDVLLEQCFLPRALMSVADSEYAFRFAKSLHEWNAPVFKLMSFYDRLFNANRLRSLIFTCTAREAEYLGHFLKLILEDLSRWHKNGPVEADKDPKPAKETAKLGAYDKEGKGTPDHRHFGFSLSVNDDGKPDSFVEHAQFRDLLFRWHKNLNTALKSCLAGSEWMHIRNAITILNAGLDYFPAIDFMATQFTAQLQTITKREAAAKTSPEDEQGGRVDLSVAAQGAMSELQRRKSKWVMVQAFRQNAAAGSKLDADKPAGPGLRATAPDFRPQSEKAKSVPAEEEDGEVKDSKDPPMDGRGGKAGGPKELLPSKPADAGKEALKQSGTPSSRSSTPKPSSQRDSRGHRLPDRPPHNLPSRPDVSIPAHFSQERHGASRGSERRDGRDSRESRSTREGRDDRDGRLSRDARESTESQDNNRSGEGERRGRGRDYATEGNSTELPLKPSGQDRERSHRERDRRGRASERGGAPIETEPQEPTINPERAALLSQDPTDKLSRDRRQAVGPADTINPERAALISHREAGASSNSSRPTRDDGRERQPRGPSPRRNPRHEHGSDMPGKLDERHGRGHGDQRSGGRDPRERSPPPVEFRGDRPMDRDADRFDHRKQYQDQNYGRLNPTPPTSDIPSGPRGRGRTASRGGYAAPAAAGRADNRSGPGLDTPGGPGTERAPPTGPSSGRGRRSYELDNSGPRTPTGPMGGSSGRNRDVGPGGDYHVQGSANSTPAAGIHPDRIPHLSGHGPSPASQNNRSHGPHISTPDRPPTGPRSAGGHDGYMQSGQDSQDRLKTEDGKRQLQGINSTLQHSHPNTSEQQRGPSGRGSQPRQMLGNSDVRILAGGSPTPTPGQERSGMAWDDSSNWSQPDAGDSRGRREHRGDRDSRNERSSRPSRRSSRERGHEDKDAGEQRDRRSMAQDMNVRDDRSGGPPRQPREPMGPPMQGGGRESRHRGDGPPAGGNWQGGGGGQDWAGPAGPSGHRGARNGGLRDSGGPGQLSDRRDGREDRGRKRRSEEGVGNLTSDRDKRPRR